MCNKKLCIQSCGDEYLCIPSKLVKNVVRRLFLHSWTTGSVRPSRKPPTSPILYVFKTPHNLRNNLFSSQFFILKLKTNIADLKKIWYIVDNNHKLYKLYIGGWLGCIGRSGSSGEMYSLPYTYSYRWSKPTSSECHQYSKDSMYSTHRQRLLAYYETSGAWWIVWVINLGTETTVC